MNKRHFKCHGVGARRHFQLWIAVLGLALMPLTAQAEIDGHGPDAWRVIDVAPNDVLNARMGPSTSYPVIETFAHDERGLEEITCVPFLTMAHFSVMTEAEREALPPRWCLMRSADLTRAGWVAQRYLTADFDDEVLSGPGSDDRFGTVSEGNRVLPAPPADASGDELIGYARDLVARLYEYGNPASGRSPLDPNARDMFFSVDFVDALRVDPPGADLLFGAQDFDGSVSEPAPDSDQPMFRGMITINVDIVNFGHAHTAVFSLRSDPARPHAPLRIFRIEHEEWSYP